MYSDGNITVLCYNEQCKWWYVQCN